MAFLAYADPAVIAVQNDEPRHFLAIVTYPLSYRYR